MLSKRIDYRVGTLFAISGLVVAIALMSSPQTAKAKDADGASNPVLDLFGFIVANNHDIQVGISEAFNGVTNIVAVDNQTNRTLMLSKMDRKPFHGDWEGSVIPPHSQVESKSWVPWCDVSGDFPLHHMDLGLAENGKAVAFIVTIVQRKGIVSYARTLDFNAVAPIPGVSRGGGERTLVVTEGPGGDFNVSLNKR